MKITKGPWHVETDKSQQPRVYSATEDRLIAEVGNAEGDRRDFHEGDANLIAAAPELYEALKAALRFIDASEAEPARFLINQIECALAKAVGKKPALAYRPEDQAAGRP